MKNKIIIGVLSTLFIITLVFSIYFMIVDTMPLFMVSFILCILFFIFSVTYISYSKNEKENFEANVNNILRLYNSILVKINSHPDLQNKNIIRLDSVEDLIDAQLEIRKPIYYIKQVQTCSFILIDNDEALVYIMKRNKDDIYALDIIIKDINIIKKQEDRRKNISDDLLSDIDKTTVVKLSDTRKYKVSPVRKGETTTKKTKKKKKKDVK